MAVGYCRCAGTGGATQDPFLRRLTDRDAIQISRPRTLCVTWSSFHSGGTDQEVPDAFDIHPRPSAPRFIRGHHEGEESDKRIFAISCSNRAQQEVHVSLTRIDHMMIKTLRSS
jgi:hypothetical protein